MNNITVFNSVEFGEVRVVEREGEPWFVAADVCRVLEIANVTQTAQRLDEDEKAMLNIGLSGGETNCINEAGLYGLILGSRKKEAKDFKRWVKHDVLPSIRKHGAYMTPETLEAALSDPDTIIRIATALKEEREKAKSMSVQIEQDHPKVLFADAVAASSAPMLIGELAKVLKQNGVEAGTPTAAEICNRAAREGERTQEI